MIGRVMTEGRIFSALGVEDTAERSRGLSVSKISGLSRSPTGSDEGHSGTWCLRGKARRGRLWGCLSLQAVDKGQILMARLRFNYTGRLPMPLFWRRCRAKYNLKCASWPSHLLRWHAGDRYPGSRCVGAGQKEKRLFSCSSLNGGVLLMPAW